ncbi:hypothetical protein A9Q88_01115 [Gammaproteobacteria bacterium 50_400_T64]|nr:hypothetical protein A9Q88_01115 [Gammaproteobacteria bacterium 50_400_T64]
MTNILNVKHLIKPDQDIMRGKMAVYGFTCLFSLVLFFTYTATSDLLNDDGMNYIYAAQALGDGLPELARSYREEVLFYNQITFLSSLTRLDLYPSAQLLSVFWQVILAMGFIAVTRSFDKSPLGQIIALAVFFSMMSLNHLRPDIIRGFGFWALQLWSVWAALRFSKYKGFAKYKAWRFALLWLVLCCASIIYRTEGIAYLVLIPVFYSLSTPFASKHWIKITSAIIILAGIIGFSASHEPTNSRKIISELTQPTNISSVNKWQRELNRLELANSNFKQLKKDIGEVMPNKWAQRSVNDVLIGGFIFHVLITLIKTLNTPLLALSFYRGNIQHAFLRNPQHKLLTIYIATGILVGLASVYSRYFVSTRYIMLPAILAGIPISLVLSQTYQSLMGSQQTRSRVWRYSLIALPVLACAYPISQQNNDKRYIQDAGQWVGSHLKGEKGIYFNEQKVAFYASDYTNNSFKIEYQGMQSLIQKGYRYAVLYESGTDSTPPFPQSGLTEYRLKTFQNKRGRSVTLYKLPTPDTSSSTRN